MFRLWNNKRNPSITGTQPIHSWRWGARNHYTWREHEGGYWRGNTWREW
jgi:hypothetical protein